MPRRWISLDENETRELGRTLAAELVPAGVLLLSGELGSGKTVLAQGIAGALGIPPATVTSPTFALIAEHQGSAGRLVHADLYRLEPEEVWGLDLEGLLAGPGVKVIEWAERLPFAVPGALWLQLRRGPGGRHVLEERETET
jgi:tRNA threonylcarbamoyladenosine biosynthesis protein TsaE